MVYYNIGQTILKHKWDILIALIVVLIGVILLNYLIDLKFKTDLLLNACELCESYGNICRSKINLHNLTIENITILKIGN